MKRHVPPMRLAAMVLVVVGVSVQAASGAGPPFTDPVGDTSAADAEWVTVTDNAAGLFSFRVKFRNRLSLLPNDRIYLYLNTDRNRSTGRTSTGPSAKYGADYLVFLTGKDRSYGVYRVLQGGNDLKFMKTTTSSSRCCASGQWKFLINGREIGNPRAFDFYVYTSYIDPAKRRFDYAPTEGVYTYQLTGGK
jgi:hypothetical protein